MIKWLFCFVIGLPLPPGKTGKREIAGVCLTLWCYGFLRLGQREASGVDMPLTADVLKLTFPFVGVLLLAAFGMHQLISTGWFQAPQRPAGGASNVGENTSGN